MRFSLSLVLAASLSLAMPRNSHAQEPAIQGDPIPPAGDELLLPPVTVRPDQAPIDAIGDGGAGYGGIYPGNSPSGDYNPGPVSWSSGAITSDQQLVGPYNQPVWTTQRPFATTRSYVLPAGTAQFEQWARPTWHDGEPIEWRMLEEVAIGLPGRFQLDLYERWNIEDADHNASHEGVQIELRYALADWGVIPFNPTLYAEWVERGGPQEKPNKYELKLLLADSLLPNLYYASNYILEQETSGERETELGWSNALSTTVVDRFLLAGFECVLSSTNVDEHRSEHDVSFLIGPSMQIRPTNRTFLDLVAMGGTTPHSESPEAQMYIIWGYQFGMRAGPAGGYAGGNAGSYASMFSGSGGGISGPAATRGN